MPELRTNSFENIANTLGFKKIRHNAGIVASSIKKLAPSDASLKTKVESLLSELDKTKGDAVEALRIKMKLDELHSALRTSAKQRNDFMNRGSKEGLRAI